MSEKLISADALYEETLKSREDNPHSHSRDRMMHKHEHAHFLVMIDNAPAVDAVEVVRCSRCVNNPQIGTRTKGMVWCRKFMSEVRPDGYCSYSERREDNAVD